MKTIPSSYLRFVPFDRNHPQRLAVVKMPETTNGIVQPLGLSSRGSSLFVDAYAFGTVIVDIDRLVYIDETQPQPVFLGLDPQQNDK
ncbi:MAG: hypothetical protein GY704_00035, partial [Phycisphaeraceae bacterium]|nr:hypothetical protein [Phycisphaeraceae bacterium]